MTPIRKLLLASALSIAGLSVAPAQAGLLGSVVGCTVTGLTCAPGSATVTDPGVEFIIKNGALELLEIDIDDDFVRIRSATNGSNSFGGGFSFTLTGLGPVTEVIDSAVLAIEGPVTGLEQDDVSYTVDSSRALTVDFGDTNFDVGGEARIRISTIPSAAVPAPGALALLGLGLVGLGLSRRRTA